MKTSRHLIDLKAFYPLWEEVKSKRELYALITCCKPVKRWRTHFRVRIAMYESAKRRMRKW